MNAQQKEQGRVKFFNETKGFGFIIPSNGNSLHSDLFFHATKVIGKLPKEGDQVEYSIGDGKKGIAAVDVEII